MWWWRKFGCGDVVGGRGTECGGGGADVHATHENFPGPPFTFAIKN